MHRVSKIWLNNFRSCKSIALELNPYTPLVGYNNAGKSTIIQGLIWLLAPAGGMCTDDFCRNNIANPIEITGELVGITEDLLSKLGDNHRKKIEPYVSEDEKLVIRRVQASPGGNKKDRPLYVLKPGEDIEKKDSWDQNPTGIDAAISNLFPSPIHIEAMQDAAQDAAKNTSTSTLGKLLKEVLGNVEAKHSDKLNDAVEDLKQLFSAEGSNRAPELDELDKTTNSALNDLFPGIEVRAEIPVPTLQALFKSGTIRVKDPLRGDDFHGFESVGHGAQRTIQMALIRSMSEMTKSNDDPACRLLLIDEPELYLHPQAIEQVRSALEKLSRNGYQVVFTTHSPTLISRKDVPNTLLIRKTSSGTSVLPTMSSAAKKAIEDNTSQSKTLFTLSNSNQILFCEKVILVEGSTEARLLPYLYETVHGRTLALDKIALVPLGGSGNTHKAIKILQGIGIPYQAVVDLDALIRYGCQYGICDEHNADYCACLSKFDDCQKNGLFILDDNGFPKKTNGKSASECFAQCATMPDFQPHIDALHIKAKDENDIWSWKIGDIECVLDIKGKKESVWSSFIASCDKDGYKTKLLNEDVFNEFMDWIKT